MGPKGSSTHTTQLHQRFRAGTENGRNPKHHRNTYISSISKAYGYGKTHHQNSLNYKALSYPHFRYLKFLLTVGRCPIAYGTTLIPMIFLMILTPLFLISYRQWDSHCMGVANYLLTGMILQVYHAWRNIPGLGYVVHNHGDRCCPLRIGLYNTPSLHGHENGL